MSKPANVDIQNLFQKFGGNPGDYQEIRREQTEQQAQHNWPIIAAMRNELMSAPKLKQAASPAAPTIKQPAPHAPAAELRHESPLGRLTAAAPTAPAPQQSASLQSLFGSLQSAERPAPGNPVRPSAAPGANPAGDLDAVFARLLHAPQATAQTAPQDDLRNMLGRLIK